MGLCKKDVTPLLKHWSYVSLALTHLYIVYKLNSYKYLLGQKLHKIRLSDGDQLPGDHHYACSIVFDGLVHVHFAPRDQYHA